MSSGTVVLKQKVVSLAAEQVRLIILMEPLYSLEGAGVVLNLGNVSLEFNQKKKSFYT